MRPDRIVVGEIRDAAALDMLQAMNTGHDGSICTVHANAPARRARPRRDDGADGRHRPAGARHPRAGGHRDRPDRPPDPVQGRHAARSRTSPRWSAWRATSSPSRTCSSSTTAGLRRERADTRDAEVDRAAAPVRRQARGRRRAAGPAGLRLRAVRPVTPALLSSSGAAVLARPALASAGGQAMAKPVLGFALLAFFLGTTVLIATVLGAITSAARPDERIRRRLSFYTLSGRQARLEHKVEQRGVLGSTAIARSAVELAERVTARRGLGDAVDRRLEAAALPIRTPEWLLIHLAITIGVGLLFLLVSGGGIVATLCGLVLGSQAPGCSCSSGRAAGRPPSSPSCPTRCSCSRGACRPGTRCLRPSTRSCARATSRCRWSSTGLSSRPGSGCPLEDALEGVGRRACRARTSPGWSWPCASSATSAATWPSCSSRWPTRCGSGSGCAGRSACSPPRAACRRWILGGLPVLFFAYLVLANPDYLRPLWTTSIGVLMMVSAVVLFGGRDLLAARE